MENILLIAVLGILGLLVILFLYLFLLVCGCHLWQPMSRSVFSI